MKKLLLWLLPSLPALAIPPPTPAKLVRHFAQACLDKNVSDSVLITHFMCPDLLLQRGNPRIDKGRKMLHYWRIEVQKHMQLSPRQLRRAHIVPSRKVPHPNFHMLDGKEDTYVLQLDKQQNWYFLVRGQQVASGLLLDQGGEAYFLDFCN